jgi:alcohol dehydrogenase class IV
LSVRSLTGWSGNRTFFFAGKNMDLSFKFNPEILIGTDTLSMAGTVCSRHGQRIMIAADHGMDTQTVKRLKEILEDSGLKTIVFDRIEEDSTAGKADNIVELSRAAHCDAIIGFGGHKTQIIARMAAIMIPMKITSFELLEGRLSQNKFLPFISIPTEGLDAFSLCDFFIAVDPRSSLIKSIQSPDNLLSAVIIDKSLDKILSRDDAALFIFDGFLTAMEAYCSAKANFFSDTLLERALNFYSRLLKGGTGGINADTYVQAGFLASLGSSVSSPGLGAALSYAINARFKTTPKQQCSTALLPFIAEKLVSARPEKMARIASFLGAAGKGAAVAEAANSAAGNIRRSIEALNLPLDLKAYNIPFDRITAAVEAGRNLEFISNSPWTVLAEDVFEIMKQIL